MPTPENVIGKGTPFTSDRQPDPKLKSEGVKKWWDRRKLAENMLREFSKPIVDKAGLERDPHESAIDLIKRALFSKDNGLSDKDKADLYLRFCDRVGIDEKRVENSGHIQLVVDKDDMDL